MSLTVRPSATMRSASASGSATASRARACPAEICPPASRRGCARADWSGARCWRHGCGSCRRRARCRRANSHSLAELGVARGLLERVEVGPLHVFDDGDLERLAVAGLDDDDRDLVQPRPLRGPPAALAGDDLVSVRDAGNGADDDRLDDAALLDRGGELVELRVVEALARVARIGAQELDRRLARAARDLGMRRVRPPSSAASPRPRRGRFSVRAAESSAMDLSLRA